MVFGFFACNGPYLLMSDDVCRNPTLGGYYSNLLVKFDADSSGVPLTMYLTSKRYGPMLAFELFHWNISSGVNHLFLKSERIYIASHRFFVFYDLRLLGIAAVLYRHCTIFNPA